MSQWDDKEWTLVGVHPVEILPPHRTSSIEVLLVQRGHKLATKFVDGKVKVDSLDSIGSVIRELGRFEIVDDRTIQTTITIDGQPCCVELTIASVRPSGRGPLLTGLVCPIGKVGGEEGAVGGFSAEVQGGYEGDSRS